MTSSELMLTRGDFEFHDWGMVLTVRKSKTIQFRKRTLEISIVRSADRALCAVHWTELHFRQIPVGRGEEAFKLPGDTYVWS